MSSSTKFIISGDTDNCDDDDVCDEQLLTNGGECIDVFPTIFADQLNEYLRIQAIYLDLYCLL